MKKSRKAAFEPKTFLAKVGDGKTITEYHNGKLEIRNSLLNVVLYDKPEIRKHDASEEPR